MSPWRSTPDRRALPGAGIAAVPTQGRPRVAPKGAQYAARPGTPWVRSVEAGQRRRRARGRTPRPCGRWHATLRARAAAAQGAGAGAGRLGAAGSGGARRCMRALGTGRAV